MGRMFRLKADLQEVCISAEYAAQKWKKEGEDDEDEAGPAVGGTEPIKAILLDEKGFLEPLVQALKVRRRVPVAAMCHR